MWRDAHIRYLEAAFRSEGAKLARARVADLYLASSAPAQYAMGKKNPWLKPSCHLYRASRSVRFKMTEKTLIDLAHSAMERAPEDPTLRLQF